MHLTDVALGTEDSVSRTERQQSQHRHLFGNGDRALARMLAETHLKFHHASAYLLPYCNPLTTEK